MARYQMQDGKRVLMQKVRVPGVFDEDLPEKPGANEEETTQADSSKPDTDQEVK